MLKSLVVFLSGSANGIYKDILAFKSDIISAVDTVCNLLPYVSSVTVCILYTSHRCSAPQSCVLPSANVILYNCLIPCGYTPLTLVYEPSTATTVSPTLRLPICSHPLGILTKELFRLILPPPFWPVSNTPELASFLTKLFHIYVLRSITLPYSLLGSLYSEPTYTKP